MMKRTLLATTGVLALGVPFGAAAQVDEIVVTATKREQTLQEVPIAVSVVDAETIQDAQIIDVFDLQSLVPSLRVNQLERANNATFFIRGFGNGGNNPGVEPSVAVFIDGVFRSRSASALSDFVDLERVEVLRGPQSTLFGKNASAGVVSFVTKKPAFEWEGLGEVTYGNFDQKIARAYVTGPISDTVAFSLSGSVNQRDGYTENLAGGPDINNRDRWLLRGQLLAQPTDSLELRVIADWDEIDEVCCTVENFPGPTAGIVNALGGSVGSGDPFDYAVTIDTTPTNEIVNNGISLQADWDLTDDIQLTSITSYRTKEEDVVFEGDFTTLNILGDGNSRFLDTETFTQEFRVAGDTGRVSWLAGAFLFDETATHDVSVRYGSDTRDYVNFLTSPTNPAASPLFLLENVAGVPTGTFYGEGRGITAEATQDNLQYQFFAQADFDITDRLTLTAGVSYFKDEKDVAIASSRDNLFTNLNLVEIGGGLVQQQAFATAFFDNTGLEATPDNIALIGTLDPAGLAAIEAGSAAFAAANATDPSVNPLLALAPLQVLGPVTDFPNAVETGSTEDDSVPYTIRLAYDVTDRLNVYGSFATGYKASSWNLTQDSRPFPGDIGALGAQNLLIQNTALALGQYAGTRFAGPEETEVIEFGLKSQFARGGINVAIFDQQIEGFQSVTFQGTGFVLANAGKQSVQGFEFDGFYQPVEPLTLRLAGTYLDAEYDEFTGAPVPAGSAFDLADGVADGAGDLSGARPAGIPEFALSASVDYRHEFSFAQGFVRADYQYETETQVTDNVSSEQVPDRQVSMLNASVGLNFENGLEAMLWGRNLNGDEFYQSAFPTTLQEGTFSAYPNAPRTYGVTLRKRF